MNDLMNSPLFVLGYCFAFAVVLSGVIYAATIYGLVALPIAFSFLAAAFFTAYFVLKRRSRGDDDLSGPVA